MSNISELLKVEQGIPLLQSQDLFYIGNFPISNSTTTNILTTFILGSVVAVFLINYKKNYVNKFSVTLEIIYEQIYDFTNKITNNAKVTKNIISLVASLFLYLVIANVITSLPPFSFLTYESKSLFRGQTSDFSTTFGIALSLIILANLTGVKTKGFLAYINEYIPILDFFKNMSNTPKKAVGHIFSFILGLFMGVLDLIGEIGKTLSVSLRLFGNMYAGQILLVVSMGLFSLVLPAFLVLFNLFSGFLQALIFTALISVYFSTHHKVD